MRAIIGATILILAATPLKAQQKADKIFHYSTMDAMRNGVYTGGLSVKEAKQKGDFGLGTFHLLDGELIALNGTIYRVATDGTVAIASDQRSIPFGSFTFFKADHTIILKDINTIDDLQKELLNHLPSKNRFYALKIEATFNNISLGGAIKTHESDTTGIAAFMKNRPVYTKSNVRGTIVGFYNPPYISGIDLSPFHFHFLSTDKNFGGHLMNGKLSSATITVYADEKDSYELALPNTDNAGYRRHWKTSETTATY
ncbi:acetolactate decarboxylase [Taibaiella sp. KBW10]|uniref:acetolactate decarboxylase n=1 Tax=Taibaiella sp. KBW10 TaxID=2153357 RepID=UPI000F5A466D|nr:acetolactate decarboxylase [Taibaiella sp. KBW10]RQO31116.1 acetolactate decarboxylase [Taibaiella sp. KBW10]